MTTEIGHGCRKEGPHGPCGPIHDPVSGEALDVGECACGCSAFEDYCQVYLDWYARQIHVLHAGSYEACTISPCRETRSVETEIDQNMRRSMEG